MGMSCVRRAALQAPGLSVTRHSCGGCGVIPSSEGGAMTTQERIATGGLHLDDATIQAFAVGQRGPVLRPGDAGFDEARRVWNGMIDRTPALIARCAGVADVIAAVNFAREHDLLVAVRSGGH